MSERRTVRKTARKTAGRERGASLVEFVLCFALFWVPFFFGLWRVGITMIRAIQVTQVCRDAAHMLAYGIDFSNAANQAVLQKVAQGMNLTTTGQSIVILSTVTWVNSSDCQANNISSGACNNANQYVITNRLVLGNASLLPSGSAYGNPKAGDEDGSGNISIPTYLTDTSCVATNFSNLFPVVGGTPTLAHGQYGYMAEMTLISPDLNNYASSARSIF